MFASCLEEGILGVLPGMMGVIQATEIIKWILGLETALAGRLLTVNALTMQFKTLHLSKNKNCVLCAC
jgi:adenylyltransferase/sulfurtransferase